MSPSRAVLPTTPVVARLWDAFVIQPLRDRLVRSAIEVIPEDTANDDGFIFINDPSPTRVLWIASLLFRAVAVDRSARREAILCARVESAMRRIRSVDRGLFSDEPRHGERHPRIGLVAADARLRVNENDAASFKLVENPPSIGLVAAEPGEVVHDNATKRPSLRAHELVKHRVKPRPLGVRARDASVLKIHDDAVPVMLGERAASAALVRDGTWILLVGRKSTVERERLRPELHFVFRPLSWLGRIATLAPPGGRLPLGNTCTRAVFCSRWCAVKSTS